MNAGNILFVYNPCAGKAKIRGKLCDIIDIFAKEGYEITVYPTQREGDAVRAVMNKKKRYDLLVCSGGDGTLDEAVNGMVRCSKKIPIGYIPAGSTNDFAMSLGLPKDMCKAAEVIVSGKDYPCDIGAFNDKCFVYIAAFGLFTDVSYETSQEIKNVLGHMAYLLEGVKRISSIKSYKLKVCYKDSRKTGEQEERMMGEGNQDEENSEEENPARADREEERVIEDEFIFGMVTNSLSVGGFKRITGKYVELDDGEFEVTLIKKPSNPLEINMIIAALLNRNINTDYMYCFKTRGITFEAETEIPWTTDGEFGGSYKYVCIENRKQAVKIRVPDEA